MGNARKKTFIFKGGLPLDMLDIFVLIGHRHDISPFLVCILSHIVGPVGLVGPEGLVGPWVW